MSETLKLKSDFALLDVKAGRAKLFRLLKKDPMATIPVTITGHISGIWGHDDGISREFQIEVENVVATLTDSEAAS